MKVTLSPMRWIFLIPYTYTVCFSSFAQDKSTIAEQNSATHDLDFDIGIYAKGKTSWPSSATASSQPPSSLVEGKTQKKQLDEVATLKKALITLQTALQSTLKKESDAKIALQQKLRDVEQHYAQRSTQLEQQLATQKDSVQRAVTAQQLDATQQQKTVKALQQKLDDSHSQLISLQNEKQQQQQQATDHLHVLQQQLVKEQKAHKSSQQEHQQLIKKIEEHSQQLHQESLLLAQKLSTANTELNALQLKQQQATEQATNKLKTAHDNAEQTRTTLEKTLKDKSDEWTKIQADLQQQLKSAQQQIKILNSDKQSALDKIAAELASTQQALAAAKTTQHNLTAKNQQSQKEDVQKQSTLQNEVDKLDQALSEKEQVITSLQKEAATNATATQNLNTMVAQLRAKANAETQARMQLESVIQSRKSNEKTIGSSTQSGTSQADNTVLPFDFSDQNVKRAYASGILLAHYLNQTIAQQEKYHIYLDPNVVLAGIQDSFSHQLKMTPDEVETVMESFDSELEEKMVKAPKEGNKQTDTTKSKQPVAKPLSAKQQQEKGDLYREQFAQRPGVKKLASGLLYLVEKPGSGVLIKNTDTVQVNFLARLVDGTVFDDSSGEKGGIALKLSEILPAIRDGIRLVKEGGKIRLVVPPNLAYGTKGYPPLIPPNATLIFDISVLKDKK